MQVDVEGPHPVERGDVFLLCSDGLSGQVSDREIGSVITALPPAEAVQFLVHMANLHGGPDNTTVIVVRVGGEPRLAGGDSQAEVIFPSGDHAPPSVPRFGLMMYYLSRIPWALILIGSGILLALVASVLIVMNNMDGATVAFVFAAVSLLVGTLAMLIQGFREIRITDPPPEEQPLRVYRQTPCPIDAAMYDKLVQSAKTLEEMIKGRNWEYDAPAYQDRLKHATQHFKHQKMRDAFREQCRAMLVLMEAVHRYRGRNEDFNPMW